MMHINLMEERHTIRIPMTPIAAGEYGVVLVAWVTTMVGLTAVLYYLSLR